MYRLSPKDAAILAAAQLKADAPVPVLAKATGYREHTVRRCLEQLKEREIISMYPFVNIYPLGLEEYAVFFSMPAAKRERHAVLQSLNKSDRVSWVLQVGGDFQYGAAICCRSATEVSAFFDTLCSKFGDVFYEKSVAARICWVLFTRKYLSTKPAKTRPLYCGDIGRQVSLDETDHCILAGLSSHRYSSFRELGQQLNLPSTTVHYRIKRLKEQKVLSGFAYGVDAAKIGMQPYRLLISMRQVSLKTKEKMFAFCEQQRNVVALIHCIGSWDYEVKVEVALPAELTGLIDELHDHFGTSLHSIKVLSVLETQKLEFYPVKQLTHGPRKSASARAEASAAPKAILRHFD